ncbi:MAG TPA: hypothetical protein VJS66_08105, partial [Burkholderiales bacterium]|nr:hypothetical protein [Burkholderiales bacterium]
MTPDYTRKLPDRAKTSAPSARPTAAIAAPNVSALVDSPNGRSKCACGGRCPRCQAKSNIGAPDDKYEQEADRVAEQITRLPDSQIQRRAEQKPVGAASSSGTVTGLPSPGAGHPLSESVRSYFEPR